MTLTSTSGQYTLTQYPQAGFAGFDKKLSSAKKSLSMWMYSMNDKDGSEAALISAHNHGADVRVILNSAFGGSKFNRPAYARLTSAGVSVHWAPTGYIFHIKTTVIDGKSAVVSTANLNAKNYSNTLDASITTTNPVQVSAINATFNADWTNKGKPQQHTVNAPGLVWSPGADGAMLKVISSAKKSIRYSSEELAYAPVVDAIAADARRGVKCQVLMTADKEWDSQFATLRGAGCTVHLIRKSTTKPYVHIKQVLVDGDTLLAGSQNDSASSLKRNRELSIQLTKVQAPNIIAAMTATFDTEMTQ